MSQSKKGSVIESVANIAIGFGIAMMAQMIIFPLYDVHITHSQNFTMTCIFTVISFVRSYILRRVFNRIKGM